MIDSEIRDVSKLVLLNRLITEVDDKRILSGYLSFLLQPTHAKGSKMALDYFLASSEPQLALELAVSTFDYENGLKIAQTFAPDQLPHVTVQYAIYLERAGRYTEAFEQYQKTAIMPMASKSSDSIKSRHGFIRMTIRTGNVGKAMELLKAETNETLLYDCAVIMQSMGMFGEAAALFERSKSSELAIECYLQVKNFTKVGYLLPFTNKNKKLYNQYARAKEADGELAVALQAYTTISNVPEQTRILIALHQISNAISLVRSTGNIEGAQMIARFFEDVGKMDNVIEFWLLAGRKEDAFRVAQSNALVPLYAELLQKQDLATQEDYATLASYLSNSDSSDPFLAGKFHALSGNYPKAIQSLLQCKHDERAMELAIKVVEESRSSTIARQVIDYFMANYETDAGGSGGGADGGDGGAQVAASSGRYLFKLYIALEQHSEAIRILKLVVNDDWVSGSYKKARDLLIYGILDLKRKNITVSQSLHQSLTLLHSYLAAKTLIRMNLQPQATKMLLRVCQNLANFQSHKCDILISAILQCQKTSFFKSMQSLAYQLVVKEGPAFKLFLEGKQSDSGAATAMAKYKRKWEQLVRRPDPDAKDPVSEADLSSCCRCGVEDEAQNLYCQNGCKSILPFCTITGLRIDKSDFGYCKNCDFPFTSSLMNVYIQTIGSNCPMCSFSISDPKDIVLIGSFDEWLKRQEEASLKNATISSNSAVNLATGEEDESEGGDEDGEGDGDQGNVFGKVSMGKGKEVSFE